jgi:hypothetical protein
VFIAIEFRIIELVLSEKLLFQIVLSDSASTLAA